MASLSGLLLFLSFPKFGNGLVAWVALIPLLLSLEGAKPAEGFKTGFLAGLIAHAGTLYWIAYVVVQYGYLPVYVGVAATLLLAAYLSLYTACFAIGVVLLRPQGAAGFVVPPLIWTVLEFGRSHLLTGFPWNNLAHSQYLFGNIIQIADVTGTYGITFAIVMVNTILGTVLASCSSQRSNLCVSGIVIASLTLMITGVYGHYRTGEIREKMKEASAIEVSLVQGNIDQNIKWDKRYQAETLNIYRNLTLKSLPSPGGIILWPETAAPFYFEQPGTLRDSMIDLVRAAGRSLLFGSPYFEERDGNLTFMNSAYLIRQDGTVGGRYDKVHLVPYGEYVPLRTLFPFFSKMVAGIGDFQPGKGYESLSGDGYRFGVLICYEAIFPEGARNYKRGGADLLVNMTNDAWFGLTSAPYQHLAMTVFRAVENRLYLARVANTGISAVVDPLGKILIQTDLFERTVKQCGVKFIDEKTIYAAYGDVFVYLCATALGLYFLIEFRRRRNVGRNT